MVKLKCCGQTFLSKLSLEEHNATHPPNWGKKQPGTAKPIQNGAMRDMMEREIMPPPSPPILSLPPTPPPTPPSSSPPPMPTLTAIISPSIIVEKAEATTATRRRRRKSIKEVPVPEELQPEEPEFHSNRTNWKEWDAALTALLTERQKFELTDDDKSYWDLAVDTIVTMRSTYYSRRIKCIDSEDILFLPTPAKRPIVSVEEHNQVLGRMSEVTQERDVLKSKLETSETRRKVLEQIEKQYKLMLSLRTEEVYRAKRLMTDTSPETRSFTCGLASISQSSMRSPTTAM